MGVGAVDEVADGACVDDIGKPGVVHGLGFGVCLRLH